MMFATAFDQLAARGVQSMDFGITDLRNASLRDFKGRWGGEEQAAHFSATDVRMLPDTLEPGPLLTRTIQRNTGLRRTRHRPQSHTPSSPDWPSQAQKAEPAAGALATTLGPLAEAPGAIALNALQREAIVRWRDERWEALERRAGRMIVRDASALVRASRL